MEEKLWRIFENVTRWLDYAEKKNTILLSFIGIQLTIGKSIFKHPNDFLICASIVLAICFFISLISFLPITVIPGIDTFQKFFGETTKDTDSLIYFADIAKYSEEEYFERIQTYLATDDDFNKYLKDICMQIVANSKIAGRKFFLFNIAAYFMIIGQIFFIISLIR